MNKKGFTVIELVVSFSLLVVVLAALLNVVISSRDWMKSEETKTSLIDFKNSMTKMIYDDIIRGKYMEIEECTGNTKCVAFKDYSDGVHQLQVIEVTTSTDNVKKGLYLEYDGLRYMLPDSDIKEILKDQDDEETPSFLCEFGDFGYESYNNIYHVVIPYYHRGLDEEYQISITLD